LPVRVIEVVSGPPKADRSAQWPGRPWRRRCWRLLIASGLHFGGVARAALPLCPDADLPAAQLTMDRFNDSTFCLINRRRAERGRGQLTPSAALHRAALGYANSMLQGHFFSHHGDSGGRSTGSTVIGRLREIGYLRPGYVWIVGENLHWTTADRSSPADVVQAWMDSAVHRKYLLKRKFEELGVAARRGTPFTAQIDGITVASEFGFRQLRDGRR
jgi:uncharacterized protein YkwD